MKYISPWQYDPVRGEYRSIPDLPVTWSTGEISAIDLFRSRTILLLGATGFLGKVLLAMLLHQFPEIRHLVIQVRPKKTLSGEKRFQSEILQSPPLRPVVEKLGEDYIRRKTTIVEGDLSLPLCGLSPGHWAPLRGTVHVVINTAGLVEFDPPLNESLITNVYGVRNLIELAQLLEAKLVHVSTCYVAGKKSGQIPEDTPIAGYYPYKKGPQDSRFDVFEELDWCEKFIQGVIRQESLGAAKSSLIRESLRKGGMERAESWGWINTYTYTKSMGEQLIARTPGLKYCIVRPAIVETSLHFPFPGWNEGMTTSAPLVLMGGEGFKHWPVRRDGPLEIIPVDLVAAGILIATAAILSDRHHTVYHLATAANNPVMLPRLVAFLGMNSRYKHKHKKSGSKLANLWKTYVETQVVSLEQLEAQRRRLQRGLDIFQATLSLLKKVLGNGIVDPHLRSLRITRRQIWQQEQTLDKFLPFMIHNSFVFETNNIRQAFNMLTDADRERLSWAPESIDWADYWVNIHTKGIEKWIAPVFVKQRGRSQPAHD
ncbi:MAG: SDR family oxidoreductase [Acidobacteria bacterium]|nr:SDR family oxidoreductase [Acidobacteriota bacterium]